MKLVMIHVPRTYRMDVESIFAVYQGRRGTFHLIGENGSAYYFTDGASWLVELEHSRTDEQHVIYREVGGSNRFWAFLRRCVRMCQNGCQYYRGCKVWLWDASRHRNWQVFDSATKTVPANADAFATLGAPPPDEVMAYAEVEVPAEGRVWTDITGRHRRVASLAGFDIAQQTVRLVETDSGRVLNVPWRRLSDDDRRYVMQLMIEMNGRDDIE